MLLNLKQGQYMGRYLESRESEFFTLSMTSHDANESINRHYHENSYVSILTRGIYYEKNEHREIFVIKPGEILFRPACYIHEDTIGDAGSTCFNIEFKSGWMDYFDTHTRIPEKFVHYKTGGVTSLYKLLINFQQDYNEDTATELIADYIAQVNPSLAYKRTQPWIEKTKQILENELECFHSLQSLSERVFVHPVHLARGFKEKTGMTIGEYQLKTKLAHAVSLLLTTTLSISAISYQSGFFDDAHFTRSFKNTYRISPHQFRLRQKS